METKDPTLWKMSKKERKEHARQRVRNGFSTQDWWNFCDYMAWVNIQALEKFKTGVGYPADLKDMDEWVTLLDQMIDGFEAHVELSNLGVKDDWKAVEERRRVGMTLYVERFGSLWD